MNPLAVCSRVSRCTGAFLVALALAGCDVDPASLQAPLSLEAAIGTDSTTGAVVETDLDDYLPGDSVRIEGRGWAAGEPVTLHLTRQPRTAPDDGWQVTADGAGRFRTAFLVMATDLGVTFNLTATGPTSGSVVKVVFTDGNLQQVTLSPSTITVSPGSPAVFTANVIMGGNTAECRITLSVIPPLPLGITALIPSPNPTTVSPGNISFSRNITFNTSAATPTGSYTVTVRAAEGGNCNSAGGSAFGSATLVVGSGNAAPVLTPIGNQTVNEETQLGFTANVTDEAEAFLTFALEPAASGVFPDGATISEAGEFTWTPTEAQGPGVYRVRLMVTDNTGLSDEEEFDITVGEVNRAPELASIGDRSVNEGFELGFTAVASDPDLPANGLSFSLEGAPAGAAITPDGVFTWTPADGPAEVTLTVRVTDNGTPALSDTETITVTVNNVVPSITGLDLPAGPFLAGTPVTVAWRFDDPGADEWGCEISWDSGQPFEAGSYVPEKSCRASRSLGAGIYTVTVKVTDGDGAAEQTATTSVVVYDPDAGFVTGGGWIDSPAGALASAPTVAGKATFAFSVRYVNGKTVPQGNLELQLHDAGMNLRATGFKWLVVDGSLAQFKGLGSVQNRSGIFGFMVTVLQDGSDRFRICVWNEATGAVVYDTHPGQALDSQAAAGLQGGSIVIHNR